MPGSGSGLGNTLAHAGVGGASCPFLLIFTPKPLTDTFRCGKVSALVQVAPLLLTSSMQSSKHQRLGKQSSIRYKFAIGIHVD